MQSERLALIVDDDPRVCRALAAALSRAGWTSLDVGDGDGALAAARARRPDLVLLDLMIPGVDGYAVLLRLKSERDLRDVPIVLVSGEAAEVHERMAREMGAFAFLEKPVDLDALQAMLDALPAQAARR